MCTMSFWQFLHKIWQGPVFIRNHPFIHFLKYCLRKKTFTRWHDGLTGRPIEMLSCQDAFLSRPLEYAVRHHRLSQAHTDSVWCLAPEEPKVPTSPWHVGIVHCLRSNSFHPHPVAYFSWSTRLSPSENPLGPHSDNHPTWFVKNTTTHL